MAISVSKIRAALGLSNINTRQLVKSQRRELNNSVYYNSIDKLARKMGVDVDITPIFRNSDKPSRLLGVSLSKTQYKHVTEIPEYALEHNTGDAVCIPVKTELQKFVAASYEVLNKTFGALKNIKP